MSTPAADAYMWAYRHIASAARNVLKGDAMTGTQAVQQMAALRALAEAMESPAQFWNEEGDKHV